MSDDLVYWKNALLGILGPIHENDPQCGWFRTRPKRGYASFPVRIWRDHGSGSLKALKAGRYVDPCEIWTWCCMNPVSEDAYNDALENGNSWPDGVPSYYRPNKSISAPAKASAIRLRQSEAKSRLSQPQRPSFKSPRLMPIGQAERTPKGHSEHILKGQSEDLPKGQSEDLPRDHSERLPTGQVPDKSMPNPLGSGSSTPNEQDLDGPGDEHKNRHESNKCEDPSDASKTGGSQPASHQCASYPAIGHNSAKATSVRHQSLPSYGDEDVSSHPATTKSSLAIILDPFADAREMSHHIALLQDDVSSWLNENGPIVDQVQADRCANYANALSNLEALSEDMRVREKKPFLDACRSTDAKWKIVIEEARKTRLSCKKAVEPFLVSEWLRRERLASTEGTLFQPPCAGSFGRAISLRHTKKLVITHIEVLSSHYSVDERLLKNETYQKILKQYAEVDLKDGKSVPGTKTIEETSVS